ncbi:hypothetical protein DICA4_A04104 [Diutina catenulata]
MILPPHYLKRHKFAQKDMTQSSTFEMSTPSEIDESCLEEYEHLITLVQKVSTLIQQNTNLVQHVSTLTSQNANLVQKVLVFEMTFVEIPPDTLEREFRNLRLEMNRLVQECEKQAEQSKQWMASSRVQDSTCLSPSRIFADPESGTPKPPVEYVFYGRPCVINHSLNELYPLELGDEMDACNISDIEGARLDDGFWYLYSRKSSKTYFEFDCDTVAKVNSRKIREYANKYQIWGLLAKFLK